MGRQDAHRRPRLHPGATDVRIRFRYTGGNNWYRTVDDVHLG
ncbi:hypothetical protein AB0B01_24575 [Streptomyces sp. NPDC044571]